jgi:molybdopterin synthase catalytic subunit
MVRVLYFAAARERAGLSVEELPLAGQSVRAILAALVELHPALASVVPQCRVAVAQRFAALDDVVNDHAELALIPPVAGG